MRRIQGCESIRDEQLAQQPGELGSIWAGERAQQPLLVVEVGAERLVDYRAPFRSQRNQGPTPVVGVGKAFHESGCLDAVDAVRYGAGGEDKRTHEFSGFEPVGWT
jgi:hypothetical protein